ncbi:succinate dehydrogenase cytochrome b subunit [Capnocytophaga canimorsus]|uniref:Succinate dehydrogenase (Or fumarate reductase) cytochrome b subunit, b558 family n=2 Tax=Capnocytophaga canimorsus TaxID=28188 RepID=F9YQT7_CAPCC|nr:succinate dehydrogenase cytochrome b subunit [Capnocytophaga canimorsus]AEK22374.1 Succinate dehydrogenase (Or fumarate reductase) cytochrome b subunit, b558 family [Capnocytophaga canimorsus Cc5]ATA77553.1 succinate dehydrogenase [Capnocytophaga canimorsus]AYW37623.1 succinate dehydrogenase [Capnocytophaga canimorsus]MDT9499024.1 succinate dehydrogenase cytochrome b subunit [Capnocytophaga canimorsus]PJI82535.1 succinate dehydrogenase / fumarate reductase cytochrome b subunit [Capnocytopha
MARLFKTSIARKVAMALSALFLIVFLVIHLAVNFTSVFSADLFNELSHFMGTNPLVQGLMQPILMLGVIFHFVMGFVLEMQNRKARGANAYARYNGAANSTWMSRNMIYSGMFILIFLGIHLVDFWVHEMTVKYVEGDMSGMINGEYRYYADLVEKMSETWRVIAYCAGFVFLFLHLIHGFQSSFQSMGWKDDKRKKFISTVGCIYSFVICGGFVFVALFHYFNHLLGK